jgi:hypothetical protein
MFYHQKVARVRVFADIQNFTLRARHSPSEHCNATPPQDWPCALDTLAQGRTPSARMGHPWAPALVVAPVEERRDPTGIKEEDAAGGARQQSASQCSAVLSTATCTHCPPAPRPTQRTSIQSLNHNRFTAHQSKKGTPTYASELQWFSCKEIEGKKMRAQSPNSKPKSNMMVCPCYGRLQKRYPGAHVVQGAQEG